MALTPLTEATGSDPVRKCGGYHNIQTKKTSVLTHAFPSSFQAEVLAFLYHACPYPSVVLASYQYH